MPHDERELRAKILIDVERRLDVIELLVGNFAHNSEKVAQEAAKLSACESALAKLLDLQMNDQPFMEFYSDPFKFCRDMALRFAVDRDKMKHENRVLREQLAAQAVREQQAVRWAYWRGFGSWVDDEGLQVLMREWSEATEGTVEAKK